MAEMSPCQRPDCDQPGKPRAMTNRANGKDIKLHLCDEDYDAALANQRPPLWLSELLTHLALVG